MIGAEQERRCGYGALWNSKRKQIKTKTGKPAYVDLVKAWGWKSFTIIYENNEGLVRLQELLKAHGPYEFPITVRQLGEGPDYR
ncbi:hypothetical protein FQA39_LY05248 [Lamprigera yunnana]|nr:hypothetical protein FQA39_LY05248 [Lamprigera yunnana]